SYPAKLAYLGTGIPVNAILGIALTGSHGSIDAAVNSVADTRAGGAILWGVGELIFVAGLAIMYFQWSEQDRREAARADRRLDRELDQSSRALAGGTTGSALTERVRSNGAASTPHPPKAPGQP
ncbi:MAG: cytochrome c oxidase assembly protein, partial [Acidimicrobiales bacterium]